MNRFMVALIGLMLIFVTPALADSPTDGAPAVSAPDAGGLVGVPDGVDPSNPVGLIGGMFAAFKENGVSGIATGIGLAVVLLMLILQKVVKPLAGDKVAKFLPWIGLGASFLVAGSFALASGGGWLAAVGAGVNAGLVSIGGWVGLKHAAKLKK